MAELIDQLLPKNEVSILAGASGAGKTTLLMHAIRCMQRNEPLFGHAIVPDLKVGYIAADRTWEAYKRLADTTGVDLDKLIIRALIDDDDIDTKLFEKDPQALMYNLLEGMAKRGADLVIVDPLVVFLGCDTRIYHTNAARLIRLNKFCRQHNLTVLGTHHATKARTDFGFKRPQDRINGSGALLGFTSTQLFLAAAEEIGKEYCEWHIVSHHAKAKVITLKRTENGLFEEFDPALSDVPDTGEKATKAAGEIVKLLAGDGTIMQRKSIVSGIGWVSPRTVDEQLKMLVHRGVLTKSSEGWYGIKAT